MDDICNNIDDSNPTRRRSFLFVFDDTIANIMTNKKVQAIIKELLNSLLNTNIKYISCIHQTVLFFCSKRS